MKLWGWILFSLLMPAMPSQANHFGLFFTSTLKRFIITNGPGRNWSDGTYANSCAEYKNPIDPIHYQYKGATGDGIYTILVSGVPTQTSCTLDIPSFEPGTDGGPVSISNYRIQRKSSTNLLQIVNHNNGSIVTDNVGTYVDDSNNNEVCKINYDNFSLNSGQTLYVDTSCKWLLINVEGTFNLQGNIVNLTRSTSGTYSAVDFDGVSQSYTIVQNSGGSGGSGGSSNYNGGTQANGGGGGGQSAGGGGGGGSGGATWAIGNVVNGNGGGSSRGGGGGGGPAGSSCCTYFAQSGPGGSGGGAGDHGLGLYIKANIFNGNGAINFSGSGGGNGSSGGSGTVAPFGAAGGSGGGGGGAGGSGGKVVINKHSGSYSGSVSVSGGSGGSPGGGSSGVVWNGNTPGNGSSGSGGNNGNSGSYVQLSF